MTRSRSVQLAALVAVCVLAVGCGRDDEGGGGGDSASSPGITDKSVKIGGIFPFSGPLSGYGAVAQGAQAYFDAVNADGGIGGRKVEYVVEDDGYEPARTLQAARRLVEKEQVFALFDTLGTPTNLAIREFVNNQKVPHLYMYSGAPELVDQKQFPWTTSGLPNYGDEGRAYAQYIAQENPKATVAILSANDALGDALRGGFEAGVEGTDVKIVARETYETADSSVDSQVSRLAASDADVFVDFGTAQFVAQAIGRVAELGWDPLHIVPVISASEELVFKPAGLENAEGILSATYFKNPEDPEWADDSAVVEYRKGVEKYAPDANPNDPLVASGWVNASLFAKALEGMEEPTRESLMKSVRNMDAELPMLLPGIRATTSGDDAWPIQALQLQQFSADGWKLVGDQLDLSGG